MKKTFRLTHPKIKYARLVDTVRRDVKKYLKRERQKELPEGFDQWDFDCKFGPTAEKAETLNLADIGAAINSAETDQLESFYIEILVKPGHKPVRPEQEEAEDNDHEPESES